SVSITLQSPAFTLFPYTTLFRSEWHARVQVVDRQPHGDDVRLRVDRWTKLLIERLGQRRAADAEVDNPYVRAQPRAEARYPALGDRKSTRLNSSHVAISYAVFCL